MFGDKVNEAAIAHAKEAFPEEACGVVIKGGYRPCKNIHETPLENFRISTKEYLRYKNVLGIVHSHPLGPKNPSELDLHTQISSGVPGGVVCNGRVVWYGEQAPIAPLVGREFIYGVYDCATLVRDWYRINHNIIIPLPPRTNGCWNTSTDVEDKILTILKEFGFSPIADDTVEVGDIWIGAFQSKNLSHAAVVSASQMLLHHLSGHVSCVQPMGRWGKHFPVRLRRATI